MIALRMHQMHYHTYCYINIHNISLYIPFIPGYLIAFVSSISLFYRLSISFPNHSSYTLFLYSRASRSHIYPVFQLYSLPCHLPSFILSYSFIFKSAPTASLHYSCSPIYESVFSHRRALFRLSIHSNIHNKRIHKLILLSGIKHCCNFQ